jgi:hypothetical protein
MRDIYAAARTVVMWLGDDDGDGGSAIDLINKFAALGDENKSIAEFEASFPAPLPWFSLVLFFAAPWFRRPWIVQEYITGSQGPTADTVFYYGKGTVTRSILNKFPSAVGSDDIPLARTVRSSFTRNPHGHSWEGPIYSSKLQGLSGKPLLRDAGQCFIAGLRQWEHPLQLRNECQATKHNSERGAARKLIPWLLWIRESLATNPLDKIYSVWELVRDLNKSKDPLDVSSAHLIIDYKAPIQDVLF